MYRLVFLISVFFLVTSCDLSSDCFTPSTTTISKSFIIDSISRVLVNPKIQLNIKQSDYYGMDVEAMPIILESFHYTDDHNQLVLNNDFGCDLFQKNIVAKVTLHAPNISEIRSASQYTVRSIDTLKYNSLYLINEDYHQDTGVTIGDFDLTVNLNNLRIVSNNWSSFYLSGSSNQANINFADGSGILQGDSLKVKTMNINHRGTNTMYVNVHHSISAVLRSTGNIQLIDTIPTTIDVTQHFRGQLLMP